MKLKIIIIIIAFLFIGLLHGSEHRKGLYVGLGAGYDVLGPHRATCYSFNISFGGWIWDY